MALTPEEKAQLSRPFPREVIKSYEGRGGKTMRYIEVDVLEARVEETDLNWEKTVALGPKGVAVHYTIKGVTRGDLYDNEEGAKYGAPQVNAEARAARRALRLFGVGADLWKDSDEDEDDEDDRPRRQKDTNRSTSGSGSKSKGSSGGSGRPSEGQVKWLRDTFKVPPAVIDRLTAGREGTASALIDALKALREEDRDEYDEDPMTYIERGLRKVDKKLITLLDAEDEDEDED